MKTLTSLKEEIAEVLNVKVEDVGRVIDLEDLEKVLQKIEEEGGRVIGVVKRKGDYGDYIAVEYETADGKKEIEEIATQEMEKTKFFEVINDIIENIDPDKRYKIWGRSGDCCTTDTTGYIATALSDMPCEFFGVEHYERDCHFEGTILGQKLIDILEVIKDQVANGFSLDVMPDRLCCNLALNGYGCEVRYKSLHYPYAWGDIYFRIEGDEEKGKIEIADLFPEECCSALGFDRIVEETLNWELVD